MAANAWFGHSRRVTTRYYRQDSRYSIGRWGKGHTENSEIQCAFAIVEMLFREIERISMFQMPCTWSGSGLKQEKDVLKGAWTRSVLWTIKF